MPLLVWVSLLGQGQPGVALSRSIEACWDKAASSTQGYTLFMVLPLPRVILLPAFAPSEDLYRRAGGDSRKLALGGG